MSILHKKSFWILSIILFIIISLGLFINGARNRGKVLGESIIKGQPIVIIEDGIKKNFFAQSNNLNQVFLELGIKVYPEDKINYILGPEAGIGAQIIVRHATKIIINNGGNQKEVRTWSENVKAVLAENKIKIGSIDIVEPGIDARLKNEMVINVIRVKIEEETREEVIYYSTEKRDDSSIYIGESQVLQTGENGKKEVKYKITYHNGGIFNNEKVSEKIIKKAINKVIGIGTKPILTVYCGGFNNIVLTASAKYGQNPNTLCNLMIKESKGHPYSINPAGPYYGLYQYNSYLWNSKSAEAGFSGASWSDPTAQIYTTAYMFSTGQTSPWGM